MTKMFTATVTMKLISLGRLSLDDTVQKWLPGTLPDGDAITIRMLLQHTSGLAEYNTVLFKDNDDAYAQRHRVRTPAELVAAGASVPRTNPPGKAWNYSNTNYVLLGLIDQNAGHAPMGDLVTRYILRPAGMRQTTFPTSGTDLPEPPVRGYWTLDDGKTYTDVTDFDPSLLWSAANIVSTLGDLQKFDHALFSGRLLPAAVVHQMVTDAVDTGRKNFRYGFGLEINDLPCGTTVGHGGEIPGYLTGLQHLLTADGLPAGIDAVTFMNIEPAPRVTTQAYGALLFASQCPESPAPSSTTSSS